LPEDTVPELYNSNPSSEGNARKVPLQFNKKTNENFEIVVIISSPIIYYIYSNFLVIRQIFIKICIGFARR